MLTSTVGSVLEDLNWSGLRLKKLHNSPKRKEKEEKKNGSQSTNKLKGAGAFYVA